MFDFFRSRAEKLERAGDVTGLLNMLGDSDAKARGDAANRLSGMTGRLSRLDRERVGRALHAAAQDPDAGVRGNALLSLLDLDVPGAFDVVTRALHDPEWFPRLTAAATLSRVRPAESVSHIAPLLKDEHSLVREQAAEIMRSLAKHADPETRGRAIRALDEAGEPLA